jgi:hypothetical protein
VIIFDLHLAGGRSDVIERDVKLRGGSKHNIARSVEAPMMRYIMSAAWRLERSLADGRSSRVHSAVRGTELMGGSVNIAEHSPAQQSSSKRFLVNRSSVTGRSSARTASSTGAVLRLYRSVSVLELTSVKKAYMLARSQTAEIVG